MTPVAAWNEAGFSSFDAGLRHLVAAPVMAEDAVRRLRERFYRPFRMDRARAVQIIHANREMEAPSSAWIEFYLEALTAFFLVPSDGRLHLTEARLAVLLGWLGDGAAITDIAERRLLTRLFLRADEPPEPLFRFLLAIIGHHLREQPERFFGDGRRQPGMIDAIDVRLLRRLLCCRHLPVSSSDRAGVFLRALEQRGLVISEPAAWDLLLQHVAAGGCADHDR